MRDPSPDEIARRCAEIRANRTGYGVPEDHETFRGRRFYRRPTARCPGCGATAYILKDGFCFACRVRRRREQQRLGLRRDPGQEAERP